MFHSSCLVLLNCNLKCGLFSPEAACEVIEAERHSHVFYEAEPDIWMVMVHPYQLRFFFESLIFHMHLFVEQKIYNSLS